MFTRVNSDISLAKRSNLNNQSKQPNFPKKGNGQQGLGMLVPVLFLFALYPVGKIAEKAVFCRSVFSANFNQ